MRRLLLVVAAVPLALAFFSAAGVGRADTGSSAVPCSKLAKLHKKLPPRCHKKPPKPASPPLLGTVKATIALPDEGADQDDMAYGDGSLWVIDSRGLLRIDPVTNAVVARIAGPESTYGGVVVADGAV
jgi:hypothetical protein